MCLCQSPLGDTCKCAALFAQAIYAHRPLTPDASRLRAGGQAIEGLPLVPWKAEGLAMRGLECCLSSGPFRAAAVCLVRSDAPAVTFNNCFIGTISSRRQFSRPQLVRSLIQPAAVGPHRLSRSHRNMVVEAAPCSAKAESKRTRIAVFQAIIKAVFVQRVRPCPHQQRPKIGYDAPCVMFSLCVYQIVAAGTVDMKMTRVETTDPLSRRGATHLSFGSWRGGVSFRPAARLGRATAASHWPQSR
jgi:hypothetical protein